MEGCDLIIVTMEATTEETITELGGKKTIGINDRELENIVLASRSASSKGPAS